MSDHYQVLGVDRDATQELISAAYRALIKAFHPDVFKGDRDFAEARTKALNAAYAVLCDPIKRRDYDLETSVGQKSEPEDSDDWARACQFFPEISSMNLELCRVSAELGNRFRESLLSSKEFNNAERVQDSLLHRMRRFRPIDFAIAARLSTACLSL